MVLVGEPGLQRKYDKLAEILRGYGSAVVAYSGGVDSTFLLAVACRVLGDRVLAVTATSPTFAPGELERAVEVAGRIGARHAVIESNEMGDPRFTANRPDRCYHCKFIRLSGMLEVARREGFCRVLDGSNVDDLKDYRPGTRALEQLGVPSPLREAGLTKGEIRRLSQAMGLPTWNVPSSPCLATRIPYGSEITVEKLNMVARAEAFLRGLGFSRLRVRHYGSLASVEIPLQEFDVLLRKSGEVYKRFNEIGFTHVALDICGYRKGSMNLLLGESKDVDPGLSGGESRGTGGRSHWL